MPTAASTLAPSCQTSHRNTHKRPMYIDDRDDNMRSDTDSETDEEVDTMQDEEQNKKSSPIKKKIIPKKSLSKKRCLVK